MSRPRHTRRTVEATYLDTPLWAWIVWILGGVVAALIASRRGRSVVGWGVLGLIFSVIAVIVVAVLPKRDS